MELKSLATLREYSEERFTKRIIHQKDQSVVFILNFNPGQELPKHKHPGTAVYLLVLGGSGTMTVDGKENKVVKDDVVWVDGEEDFSFKNTGDEPASLYVVLAKIPDARYAQDI